MKKAADFEELGVEAKKSLAESLPDELLTRGKLEIGELGIDELEAGKLEVGKLEAATPAIALVENSATSDDTRQASEL